MQDDLPGSVFAQVIAQMGISGIHRATVAAQVLYDRPTDTRMYEVEWDPQLWRDIVEYVKVFYDSLSDPEPPMLPQDLIDALLAEKSDTTAEGEEEWDDVDDPDEHRDGVPLGRLAPTFVTASRVKADEELLAKLDALHAHYVTKKALATALGVHPSSIGHHLSRESKTIEVDLYAKIMNHQPQPKQEDAA